MSGNNSTYYRRNLPHYQPAGTAFFVTFRLANSLPREAIERLMNEQRFEEKRLLALKDIGEREKKMIQLREQYFSKFDQMLDKVTTGSKWLRNDTIAKIVADTIHDFDTTRYDLICFTIMPNHVHLVVDLNVERTSPKGVLRTVRLTETERAVRKDPFGEARATHNNRYVLTSILRIIKGRTAFEANRILQRRGAFWQHESYDHVVRNEKELERIVQYVLNNPVKAGLVDDWKEWKWTYCKYDL